MPDSLQPVLPPPAPPPPARPAAVCLARLLIQAPRRTVLMRVRGDSMRGAGIRHGDLLLVERRRRAGAGQVVVALLQGGLTLKRLARRRGGWWLEAAHPDYPALALAGGRLWGVALQRIRPFGAAAPLSHDGGADLEARARETPAPEPPR